MKYYAIKRGKHQRIIKGEWKDVEPEVRKEITGVSNPKYKGFKTEAEALRYLHEDDDNCSNGTSTATGKSEVTSGNANELTANPAFEFTSDAVIFVDGSRNFDAPDFDGKSPNRKLNKNKNFYFSPYGIIIFFRDGSVFVETAKLIDGGVLSEKETSYISYRHGFTVDKNNVVKESAATKEIVKVRIKHEEREFNNGCVLTSWNDTSELEAARRALDICFNEKNVNNIDIYYDCATISKAGNTFYAVTGQAKEPSLNSNITSSIGDFCRSLNNGKRHIGFHWIEAHSLGTMAAKFNDCVDVLAKSETYNKPIGATKKLNPNLAGEGVKPFRDSLVYSDSLTEDEVERVAELRRKQAYELIQKVVTKESIRPKFI